MAFASGSGVIDNPYIITSSQNWDFVNTWTINPTIQGGFPSLSWEGLSGSSEPISASFIIIYPNGGEMFGSGQLIPISWSFNPGS